MHANFYLIFIQIKDALTNIEIRLDYPRIIEYIYKGSALKTLWSAN